MKKSIYSADDISAVFSDKKSLLLYIEGLNDISSFHHHVTLTKAVTGALLGSIIGIFVGYAFGEGLVPNFHDYNKFGPIPTAIFGWAVLGAVGTWIGGWIGTKMPEYETRSFIKKLSPKDILLTVHFDDPTERIHTVKLLQILGAKEILTETELTHNH
jgi:hypothetical protein